MHHDTPCIDGADDRARILMHHRTPYMYGADDRARISLTHRTPCNGSAHDRARILMHHRTPCTESGDDRAGRLMPHRTPCTEGADDRARIFVNHRTPCTQSADDGRADKRCTPCSSSGTSPRARMAPLSEGLSSASCLCSLPLGLPLRPRHRRCSEPPANVLISQPSLQNAAKVSTR